MAQILNFNYEIIDVEPRPDSDIYHKVKFSAPGMTTTYPVRGGLTDEKLKAFAEDFSREVQKQKNLTWEIVTSNGRFSCD